MKTLQSILRLPEEERERYGKAHAIWLALALTGLGLCVGVLGLMFSATAYVKLNSTDIFLSYFHHPLILLLNLLPGVLLIWLFYFVSRRAWVAFLCSFVPVVGVSMVNYFKIRLRSDPILATDLRLAAEAGGIVGGYTLDLTWLVWFALGCLVAGTLFAFFLMSNGIRGWKKRLMGALATLAVTVTVLPFVYMNPAVYQKTANNQHINQWSDVEVFVSRGCMYPFLYSFRDMFPTPPQGYVEEQAAALLEQYPDADISEEKKVSVMGIMLEAFCDLTDFEALAGQEGVAQVYAPWHTLEEQSVSGDLLTNIFAGGTVDSEWGFLTGYTTHDEFRSNTDSYVWYLRNQGYQTFGSHPGYGWFYNRQNVNEYLGFEEYWFTENHYGDLVDPVDAVYHSDHILADELLQQMKQRVEAGPAFSFSVAYQNHGPYEEGGNIGPAYLTPESSGLSEQTCHIFNNYLYGVEETISAMTELTAGLEELAEPVVLVLFGDHKPWGGNGNAAYMEVGADFDVSTMEGFYDYYSTPYLIWANSAAKDVLDNDFTGTGGDFSPCFLMTQVFDQCGWEGPGFMQLSRQLRALSPLVHTQGLFLPQGQLVNGLNQEDLAWYRAFLGAQYYREQKGF